MDFSNYDWKLSSNVHTKIVLKRLEIRNESTTQNEAVQTRTRVDGAQNSSNSNAKRKSGGSTSSKTTRETKTNPADNDGAFNLNSGDIIQELQKVIVDFDPGCSTCSNVILQLSRHIRDTHSTQAQPPRSRSKTKSSQVHESETCPSPTIVPPPENISLQDNYPCDFCDESFPTTGDLQSHLGSHTPPAFETSPSGDHRSHLGSHTPPSFATTTCKSHEATTSVQQAASFEVTDGGHRRSTRMRKTINYADLIYGPDLTTTTLLDNAENRKTINYANADLISGPKPTTTAILESSESDSTRNENGHQDCSSLNTGDEIKVEEIDISDNEDPSYILEKYHDDDDGDLSGNGNDGIGNDDYSEPESEKEDSLAPGKEIQAGKKVGIDKSRKSQNEEKISTGENGINVKKRTSEVCNLTFRMTRLLTRHNNRFHSGGDKNGGKYKCKTCGERFYLRDGLIIHNKTHTKIKCEIKESGKSLIRRKMYKKLHTGEKTKTFLGESSSNIHKGIKSKEKTCKLCNLTFRMTETLKRHNYIFHSRGDTATGGKYKCKTCGKRFYLRRGLTTHNKIHTRVKLYKCEIEECGKSVVGKKMFIIHKRSHTGEKIYKCKCCAKEFLTRADRSSHIFYRNRKPKCKFCRVECLNTEDLNEHMKSTHSEEFMKPYKCNICKSMKFETGKKIRSHFEETHPEILHVCKFCKKMFAGESDLNKHLLLHKKDDRYKCEYCSRGFPLPHNLEEHLRVHTKEKPHKCEVCGKCFAAKEALLKHKDSHTGGKSHTCEKCDQSFDSRDILLTHSEEIHAVENSTGEKIKKRKHYGCGICSSKFFTFKDLSNHLRRCHANVVNKEYECKFCEEKFFTMAQMNEHVEKSHPGQKSFQCKICNKEFTKEYMLVNHSIIHTEEKTVSCTHPGCEKKFKTRIQMKKHSQTHTGIKAYKCDECGKAFVTWGGLTTHKNIHTGLKPFMCEICSKCFSRKTTLDNHAKIHTNDKSHVCKECGKCFTNKGQLTTHSKIHTGVKEHLCEECGISFRLPHQLRAHLKTQAHTIRK